MIELEPEGWITLCDLPEQVEVRARRCPRCAFFLFRDEWRVDLGEDELARTWRLVLVRHARRAHPELFSPSV